MGAIPPPERNIAHDDDNSDKSIFNGIRVMRMIRTISKNSKKMIMRACADWGRCDGLEPMRCAMQRNKAPQRRRLGLSRFSKFGDCLFRLVREQKLDRKRCIVRLSFISLLTLSGCSLNDHSSANLSDLGTTPLPLESTDIDGPTFAPMFDDSGELIGVRDDDPSIQWINQGASEGYRDVTLNETFEFALSNSTVLRDLGARLVQSPTLARTVYGPAIQATDPRFGVEGALSEFDAQFATRAFFEMNDRALNNELLGGGVNFFRQDLWRIQSEIKKKSATGTEFSIRHNLEDDFNNATRNLFGPEGTIHSPAWSWNLETEIRQPLLQGRGTLFNRIAGRSQTPGAANGVMIAQTNANMSLAEFQIAVRNFVNSVENAYWDLYLAYRDLDAKRRARNLSLETWRNLQTRVAGGIDSKDKVEQAAEQFYRFEEEVENAANGRLVEGTRSFSGSGGGSVHSAGGVRVAERRLRLLMGLPLDTEILLRPSTEPPQSIVRFDRNDVVASAVAQRAEVRLQELRIRNRKLELIANRNYLQPQLDLVARYRWRGLGGNLYDPNVPGDNGIQRSNTHEWLLGAELAHPIGFRQAHAAVRHSKLRLARERAVLVELERQIIHDLSNALANAERAYQVMQATFNRHLSAKNRYNILAGDTDSQSSRNVDFNLVLDAERRLLDSETSYYRARVDYALALKNINFERGSLLAYCNVHMAQDAFAP